MEYIIVTLLVALMIEVYVMQQRKPKAIPIGAPRSLLIDTSALIDGRIVGVAQSGFMPGQVIIPRSVLAELQYLADGSDHDKRSRARQGLDNVNELKLILKDQFSLYNDEAPAKEGVDARLIKLARAEGASIVTLDYNLNKVAQVEGVNILNINELAKTLRMLHLPGDVLTLSLTQKGQDSHQAIGHLPDGTMVVVEQAKKHIGKTEQVEIIRSLQTDAGKMMFAKLVTQSDQKAEPAKKDGTSAIKQGRGRRPVKTAMQKQTQTAEVKNQDAAPLQSSGASSPQKKRQPSQTDARPARQSPRKPSTKTNQSAAAPDATSSTKRRRPKTSAQREDALMKLVEKQ